MPKARNRVEMADLLKKQSIMDPKMRHQAFFTLTEKVNLEAARPRVRPFGNFRKFSLYLAGNTEANSDTMQAPLSTSSSEHQLAPGLPNQADAAHS